MTLQSDAGSDAEPLELSPDDRAALIDSVGRLLADVCAEQDVRRLLDADIAHDAALCPPLPAPRVGGALVRSAGVLWVWGVRWLFAAKRRCMVGGVEGGVAWFGAGGWNGLAALGMGGCFPSL